MTRKFLLGQKDAQGAYLPPEPVAPEQEPDLDIDSLMKRGLAAIARLMRVITTDISTGCPSRETVQNLKDAMSMLKDLKERETELLESMSDEELEKLAGQ